MAPDEYRKMAEVEDAMWYYRGLHAHLLSCLSKYGPADPGATVLDAGCGTGGFLRQLAARRPAWRIEGVDFSEEACRLAALRSKCAVRHASVDRLPFADGAFDAIVCADVLSNVEDPAAALVEMRRCVKPRGTVVLNVAAYPWLWSYHDEAAHTLRRFYRSGLLRQLADSGWRLLFCSHWNLIPLPLIVARRKLFRPRHPTSDVRMYPAPAEAALRLAMRLERAFLDRGGRLPAGSSLLIVGRNE